MKLSKRILSLALAAATAFSLCSAPAFAATSFKFTYPNAAVEVNSTTGSGTRYLTTLAQRASSEIPLILGLNIIGGNIFNGAKDMGGTNVNENPDPYLWNFNYLYPGLKQMTAPSDEARNPEAADLPQNEYYRYLGNQLTNPNGLYQSGGANQVYANVVDEMGGVGYAVGLRADVMIGFNSQLVDQIDRVRNQSKDSEFYQEGDENYSPLIVDVQTGSVTSRLYTWEEMAQGINGYLAEHPEFAVRYGDPEVIAINLEEFSAGIPYYIAAKIADGSIQKKTLAYVSQIDGKTLTCVDPRSLGNVRSDVIGEVNNFDFLKGTYTLDKIVDAGADVIVLGATGYGYSGSGSTSTGATTNSDKQTILSDLADLGVKADDMPVIMDQTTTNVTLGGQGYNYAPTTPMYVPNQQVYAYMDELAKINDAINPAAMVQFMVDEFAHVSDSACRDVALYYIGSNWDSVDEDYDQVPDIDNYKYDKDAIISAIREGITYALSEDAFTNNNTLIGAYRQTDTAYTLLTENATTKKPDDSHSYITLNENGVTRYLDLTALTETDDNSGGNSTSDTSAGTFTNVRTSYQAIVDYYNTSSYGYGDDLTTTLQKYADRMYDHVWSPDTTYAGTYGYGIPSKASPNQNSGYLSPFTDVPLNAWYVAAVRYANASGLMKGVSDTEFSPETNLTRAQVVQILYNLEKKPSVDGAAENFADVDDGDWYSDAVKWAVSNDVVKGLSDTEFGPDVQSNRETTATLLFRYAGHKEFDVSTEGADLSKYTDAGQIHDWAAEGMQWANVNGIINGVSATELSPLTLATRAQMAQIMKGFTSNSKFKSK